jgi:predicted Zn-dependent peptidase
VKSARSIPAALLLALTAPALCSAATIPVSHQGGAVIATQEDPSASLVGVELTVQAGLDREQLRQSGLAALTAETILLTPVAGEPLQDAVAAQGGGVHFSIEPTGVRFYVQATASQGSHVLALFSRAISAPDFSAATVDEARERLVRAIAEQQQEPLEVGVEMLDLSKAGGNNVGLPVLGNPATLAQLGPADVRAFFGAYYRRTGSSVSAAGRVDALGDAALSDLAQALASGGSDVVRTRLAPIDATGQTELVAHRDVSAPWLVVQYDAPSVRSADYGPMLVLAAFLQRTLGDIAEVPGTITPTVVSQAVGATYDYDSALPSLVLYVDGGIGQPSQTFSTALSVVGILGKSSLQGSIDQFKRIAASRFLLDASTLETRARLAGIFARRTGSADYVEPTLRAIAATTPADLERVARRYLGKPTIALVLPRVPAQN